MVECQLVAVDVDGHDAVVATWQVPPEGHGTPANPVPLLLQAATALPRTEIDRFEVRHVDPGGVVVTLATVEV
jgi:hypothetical protein